MKVELHLFASLAAYLPDHADKNTAVVEVAEGTVITEFLTGLNVPKD
jgi:hypothetical protein